MTDIATLGIKIEASDIKRAVAELDRLEKQGKETESRVKKLRNSFSGLGGAISALGLAVVTKKLISQVSVYQSLSNKLKLVTDGTEELAQVQSQLFDVAQDTRASYEATIDLYSRLARSTEELELSQTDLLGITESVNQAVAISGVEAASASAALFQLGQGLAADALRGQELNSVMEQTPRLARAIADGLGVEIGALRELAAEGKLTAEVVTTALKSQASVLATEFDQTEKTISQAYQQIENAALKTFGAIEGGDLVESMDEFREILSDPAIVEGLQSIAGVMIKIVELGVQSAAGWGMIFGLFTDKRSEIEVVLEKIKETKEAMDSALDKGATGITGYVDELKVLGEEYGRLIEQKRIFDAPKEEGEEGSGPIELKIEEIAQLQELQATADAFRILQSQETSQALLDDEISNNELIANANSLHRLNEERSERIHREAMKNITMNALGNLSSLMNARSKKLFKIGKIASLATATIKGYEAIVSSYAHGASVGGPLVGAAFAATAALATGVQIQNINAQQFGGGGGVSAPSGGGGSNGLPQSVPTVAPALGGPEAGQNGGGQLILNITGGVINEEFMNDELIPALQDFVDNKDGILIRSDSRNGQEFFEA